MESKVRCHKGSLLLWKFLSQLVWVAPDTKSHDLRAWSAHPSTSSGQAPSKTAKGAAASVVMILATTKGKVGQPQELTLIRMRRLIRLGARWGRLLGVNGVDYLIASLFCHGAIVNTVPQPKAPPCWVTP